MHERDMMLLSQHPFILQLVATFKDRYRLFMLLEFVQGGELFNVVHTSARDGVPLDHARFYAAVVTSAFGYLSANSIAYRDLKPENLMVDTSGYLKVPGALSLVPRPARSSPARARLAPRNVAPLSRGARVRAARALRVFSLSLPLSLSPTRAPSQGRRLWLRQGRQVQDVHAVRHAGVPRARDRARPRPQQGGRLVGDRRARLRDGRGLLPVRSGAPAAAAAEKRGEGEWRGAARITREGA